MPRRSRLPRPCRRDPPRHRGAAGARRGPQAELSIRIENMTPGEPFSERLAAIPTSPEIDVHSIIPVLGTGPIGEGNDGVVEYASAHIEGVESELILPNAQNTIQGHTNAIEEVCHIFSLHSGVEWRGRCSKRDRR